MASQEWVTSLRSAMAPLIPSAPSTGGGRPSEETPLPGPSAPAPVLPSGPPASPKPIGVRSPAPVVPSPASFPLGVLPKTTDLPSFDPKNPGRPAVRYTLFEGILYTGHPVLGDRPVGDYEFFPSIKHLPSCYVRWRSGLSIKEGTIPKESVLYDFKKAQAAVVQLASDVRFLILASQLSIGVATYRASGSQVFPFASKGLEAVLANVKSDKATLTSLEECKPTSLLLPSDSASWDEVHLTFSSKKLAAILASRQLKDRLPLLPGHHLRRNGKLDSGLLRVFPFKLFWRLTSI